MVLVRTQSWLRPGESRNSTDGGLHDEQDSREAMTHVSAADRLPDAVEATRNLSRFYEDRARWSEVQPNMQCLFELADERNDSSPGE